MCSLPARRKEQKQPWDPNRILLIRYYDFLFSGIFLIEIKVFVNCKPEFLLPTKIIVKKNMPAGK